MKLKQFLKDSGSNYVIYALQLLIGVVAVPVYLTAYGDSLYGVYLLSIGLASSFIFLQFGSGQAILRYVAEYLQDRDEDKYGLALKTCIALSTCSSLLVLCVFLVLAYGRNAVFDIPTQYSNEALWLLVSAGFYAFILFLAQIPQSMLKGAGVFYQRNKLVLVELIARALLVFSVYSFSIGIYWLLVGDVLILMIALFFDFFLLARLKEPLLRIDLVRRAKTDNIFSGEVWDYAKNTFFLSIISFFSQNSDRLVIALFLDVRYVTVYNIITKPFNVIKSLLSKVFVVLNPYYIKILKTEGDDKLNEFLASATKVLVLAVSIPILFFTSFLPEILEIWLGTEEYGPYVIYGQLLLVALVLRSVTSLYNNALYTIGETLRLLKVNLVAVGLNLVISLILIQFVGVGAVVVGTCAQLVLVGPLILLTANKYFGSNHASNNLMPWYLGSFLYSAVFFAILLYIKSSFESLHYYWISGGFLTALSVILALSMNKEIKQFLTLTRAQNTIS